MPNNGTSWYQNTCIQSALGKGAGSTALDAVGLLPEGGAFSAAFSLWHGAAGVSNGTKILQGVKAGAGIVSTASGLKEGSAASVAFGVAGFIPGAGQAAAMGSIGVDIYKTGMAVSQCP